MREIETLLPHRRPFVFLDKIESASRDEIIGTKIFSDSDELLTGSFPGSSFVPGVVLIEALAQCGGAGIKKLGLANGYFALASIDSAMFYSGVDYQSVFRMIIKNIKIGEKYVKQTGIGYVNEQKCIEATWTCLKFA